MRATYNLAPVPEFGTVRESGAGWVHVWARWILRATTGDGEHYTCRAFDSLPKLRRYVRALRAFGFHNNGGKS